MGRGRPTNEVGTLGSITTRRTRTGWEAYGRVRDPDGVSRKVLRAGATEAKAVRNLKAAVRDRVQEGSGEDVTLSTKLETVADLWLASSRVQGLAARTKEQYERQVRVMLKPRAGGLRVRELTVGTVSTLLARIEKDHGASTAKMSRSVLSGICTWTAKRVPGWTNPVRDADPIHVQPKSEPRSMTTAQVQDLLLWASYHDPTTTRDLIDLVRWMAATGLRIGEATAVRPLDVDLGDEETRRDWRPRTALPGVAYVAVTGNLVRVRGKGIVRQQRPGHKLNPRTLRIPRWAALMLADRMERLSPADDGPLFPAPMGGWRDPSNTGADLRELRAFAGYGWVKSHTLRKTVATLMDEAGLSARQGADQLGHRRPSMTQDRYWGRRATDTGAADVLEQLEPDDRENGGHAAS